MDEKWQTRKEIFETALNVKAEERPEYLLRACGDDKSLLVKVESLLSSFSEVGSIPETPFVPQIAEIIHSWTGPRPQFPGAL